MLRGSLFVAVALGSACTFGSPGTKGDSAGSIAGEDTGDDHDTGMSSTPGDDGDGGGTAGMSSGGTGMPTSGLPGEGSSSGAPVDPDASATDDGMSSGGVEPTTSSTGEPVDPTMDAGSSDDGDPPGPGYPECASGEDSECGAGNNCVVILYMAQITETVCGEGGCSSGDDCDPPSSGNAVPFCAPLSINTCVLGCDGATCPAGMECVFTDLGEVCAWD